MANGAGSGRCASRRDASSVISILSRHADPQKILEAELARFVMEQMKDKNAARAFYAKASQLEEPYTWGAWAMSREEALYVEELEEQKKAEKQAEE